MVHQGYAFNNKHALTHPAPQAAAATLSATTPAAVAAPALTDAEQGKVNRVHGNNKVATVTCDTDNALVYVDEHCNLIETHHVRHGAGNAKALPSECNTYTYFDESMLSHLSNMGCDRNFGTVNLMPIVVVHQIRSI